MNTYTERSQIDVCFMGKLAIILLAEGATFFSNRLKNNPPQTVRTEQQLKPCSERQPPNHIARKPLKQAMLEKTQQLGLELQNRQAQKRETAAKLRTKIEETSKRIAAGPGWTPEQEVNSLHETQRANRLTVNPRQESRWSSMDILGLQGVVVAASGIFIQLPFFGSFYNYSVIFINPCISKDISSRGFSVDEHICA